MQTRAFLDVTCSATGRRWVGPGAEADRLAERMAQETGLPLALAGVLVARGIAPAEAARFLEPQLRDLLPDPRSLKDMAQAAGRFRHAAEAGERIAIFADYDVDGGASAALLISWLRAQGRSATLYVPDRIEEGYGPNAAAMRRLAAAHDLIVCVDCGTLGHEPMAAAAGTDVIVLDHHLGGETLPPALAVVNPNRADEDGALAHLCAASVVFLMLVEVNRQCCAAGRQGPDLMALLDLVALATVADVAPLIGVNRALVRQGLRVMARRERVGLRPLPMWRGSTRRPTPITSAFVLGPRVNAGGRIGAADLGARLLATDDPFEAAALAERLDRLNSERREIEMRVREAAMAQAEARGLDAPLVWAAGEGWHPGVVGIVAARLKEATNRPAVVIGLDGRRRQGLGPFGRRGRSRRGGAAAGGRGAALARRRPPDGGRADRGARTGSRRRWRGSANCWRARAPVRPGRATCGSTACLMPGAVTPALIEEIERAGPFGAGRAGAALRLRRHGGDPCSAGSARRICASASPTARPASWTRSPSAPSTARSAP